MEDRSNLTPAPASMATSRACSDCARAKAKCVTRLADAQGRCDRCSRLGKQCVFPSPSVRKRKAGRRSRVEEMEAKIDGLVQLLSSQQKKATSDLPPTPSSGSCLGPALSSTSSMSQASELIMDSGGRKTMPTLISGEPSDEDSSQNAASAIMPNLTFEEADKVLDVFRQMLLYFPFMILPSSVSAEELAREKPFLYSCIMALRPMPLAMRIEPGKRLMQYLADKMIVKGERSLDLLLGIMTYTAWFIHKSDCMKQVNTALQLAMALVYDLGLNRPRYSTSNHQLFFDATDNPEESNKASNERTQTQPSHTLEEQRAFVGCFFLTSSVATYFQKVDSVRVTPYLEECICNLQQKAEHSSDIVSAFLARLQIIVQQTSQAQSNPSIISFGFSTPMALYIKALQAQLEDVRSGLTQTLLQDPGLLMYCHIVEMGIYEIGLSKAFTDAGLGFQRLDLLHTCLMAIKGFFEKFQALPITHLKFVSFFTWTQVANAMLVLHNLTLFIHPGWDTNYVLKTISFSDVVGHLIAWFELMSEDVPDKTKLDEGGPHSATARKLARVKAMHEKKLSEILQGPGVAPMFWEGDLPMAGETFNSLNDSWLEELLGPFTYQPTTGLL